MTLDAEPIRRRWLPDHLQDVSALAVLLLVFTSSNHLAHESGLLAVTVNIRNIRE